jgi:nucleotidyltransferase AbiEii toxin of type IV toxin-antitoxin system
MTGTPEKVPPLTPVSIPGLDRPDYHAYPLVDHIADKTCAVVERHGPEQRASTRFKDLVDLVTLARNAKVVASEQIRALNSEAARRSLDLPETFDVADRALWQSGFAAEARRAVLPVADTLDEALAIVRPFLDPILAGTATGMWDHETAAWKPVS